MKYVFYFICGLIAYGSLYPFEFSLAELSTESWQIFSASWFAYVSKGDLLGNLVLFFPFGFLAFYAFDTSKLRFKCSCILWAAFLFGLLLQLIQLAIPARDAILSDVVVNVFGAALGLAVAGSAAGRRVVKSPGYSGYIVELSLLACWTIFLLSPFVPTIDFSKYKEALKPLLFEQEFSTASYLLITAGWLVALRLIVWVRPDTSKLILFAFIVLSWLLKIVIVNAQVALHDVVAGLTAMGLCVLLPIRLQHSRRCLIGLLLVALVIDGLRPFEFTSFLNTFYWLPFEGALTGSIDTNIAAIALKLYLFASIIWLQMSAGKRATGLIFALLLTVLLLEISQIWLMGRTAEITDPLLVIAVAWLLGKFKAMEKQRPVADRETAVREVKSVPVVTPVAIVNPQNYRSALVLLVVGCVLLVIGMLTVLQLPNIPYNVKELFRFDANGIDLFFFALALLGFGIGGVWTGYALVFAKRPWLTAPIRGLTVSLVIYFCMLIAATQESLADISGSANIVYQLTEKQIFGFFGNTFIQFVGKVPAHQVALIFEPVIRFSALIAPSILFLALFVSVFLNRWHQGAARVGGRQFILRCTYLLPWFLLVKVITFDFSSTDNLNELIARDNEWGINGGPYLYALLIIITLHAVALATAFVFKKNRILLLRVLAFGVVVPVGWLLINAGLVEAFTKYSDTYSGVDFLLGPDRENKLSTVALMLRWSFLQISTTVLLCYGAVIALKLYKRDELVIPEKSPLQVESTPVVAGVEVAEEEEASERAMEKNIARDSNDDIAIAVRIRGWHIDGIRELVEEKKITPTQAFQCIIDDTQALGDKVIRKHLAVDQAVVYHVGDEELYSKEVHLTPEQASWIQVLARQYRLTESRVIRRLLDSYFDNRRTLLKRLKGLYQ